MSDSFLDTVTRLIGCELLLGSSVFPLSVFHWMVWQYKSSPGALQLVGFPVPQLLMEAPEQEDPRFSHPPASPSFSFFFFCSGEFLQLQYSGCSWGKVCLSLHWLDNGRCASFVP